MSVSSVGTDPRLVIGALAAGCVLAFGAACSSSGDSSPTATTTADDRSPGGPPMLDTVTPAPTTAPRPTPTPTPESYADALDLYRAGEFDAAADAYEFLAESEPDDGLRARALAGAAAARNDGGDPEGATVLLEQAVAVAPPGSEIARQSAYLLARRANERGEHAIALDALRPYADADTSLLLQPAILAELGTAAFGSGDAGLAETAWDAALASPATPGAVAASIYLARFDAAEGNPVDQVRWLQLYVQITGDPSARVELAELARATGDLATWEAQLRQVLFDAPGGAASVVALDALLAEGLEVDAGRQGQVLYRAGLYDRALALDTPGPLPADVLVVRDFYIAATYEALRDYPTAISYYDKSVVSGAVSPFVHRSKWWAAVLTAELEDAEGASARYLDLAANGPPGEFSAQAAVRAGLVLLTAGEPAAALAAWDAVGLPPGAQTHYWRGRAFQALGDGEAAAEAFAAAMATDPASFHATEAARELGEAVPDPGTYRPLPLDFEPDWDSLELWLAARVGGEPVGVVGAESAAALAELGLRDQAKQLLLTAEAAAGPWELLALARSAYEAGLTELVIRFGTGLHSAVAAGERDVPIALTQLEYPLDYVVLLDDLAREADIDPLWMAGLVRSESLWDPRAVSFADARGLTQVIPATGESIAANLGVPFAISDLFRPAVSLRFGVFYVDAQLNRFGAAHIALAAYNAGPGNAERWAAAVPADRSPADYVEQVDFTETHGYVQNVLAAYAQYVLAYRGKAGDGP